MNTTLALILAAVGAIGAGFMAGWVLGWGHGKSAYAAKVSEQSEQLSQLSEELEILSRALQLYNSASPVLSDLRVPAEDNS